MKVLFTKRHCGHWPGANPNLDPIVAGEMIKNGYCLPYSDELREKVKKLVAEADDPNVEEVSLVPAAHHVAPRRIEAGDKK